jgi:hypothetical protein
MAFRMGKKEYEDIKRKSTGAYTVEEDIVEEAEKVARDKQVDDEQSSLPGYVSKGEDKWAKEWRKENERQKVASDKGYKKKRSAIRRGKEYGEFKDEKSAKKLIDKLSKENPKHRFDVHAEMTDYGLTKYVIGKRGMTNDERKAESLKRKNAKKQAMARAKWVNKQGKSITRASENIGRALQPGSVPQYTAPNMNFGKSGYTPLKYRTVEGVKQHKYVEGVRQYKGVGGEPYYRPSNIQPTSDAPYYSKGEFQPNPYLYSSSANNKVPFVKSQPKRTTKKSKKQGNTRFKSI